MTDFKGTNYIGLQTESEIITTNLIYYFDHNFVDIGGYFNVEIPTTGSYGGSQHILRSVTDPRYTNGQVWEGFRGGWVWQSGVNQPTQPIQVSGAFVNNEFVPIGTGCHVDYVNGQIVFEEARPTTATVTAEYSHKWVNVYDADYVPWFQKYQYRSFRADNNTFNTSSGDYAELAESRVRLPAVFIETIDSTYAPFQLGGGQWHRQEYIFHVIAEDAGTAKRLGDILGRQNEKKFYMFSPDLVANSGTFPLDYRGSLNTGAKTFPQLTELFVDGGYRWANKTLRIFDARKQQVSKIHQNLYHRPVRVNTEIVLWDI